MRDCVELQKLVERRLTGGDVMTSALYTSTSKAHYTFCLVFNPYTNINVETTVYPSISFGGNLIFTRKEPG